MNIVDVKNVPSPPNPHNVKASRVYDSEHATAVHITLEAGERLKKHITPVDVFFYILEGEPTIEIGDEKVKVSADRLVESPAKIPHCIHNETDHVARILVVKVPRPTSQTKIL